MKLLTNSIKRYQPNKFWNLKFAEPQIIYIEACWHKRLYNYVSRDVVAWKYTREKTLQVTQWVIIIEKLSLYKIGGFKSRLFTVHQIACALSSRCYDVNQVVNKNTNCTIQLSSISKTFLMPIPLYSRAW